MLGPTLALIAATLAAPTPSPAWDQACLGVADFWPDTCERRFDNAYQRGLCKAAQDKAMKESHIVLKGVRKTVVYNAKMQRFEVTVPALMQRDILMGACGGNACVSRVVVSKYLTWPIRSDQLRPKLEELERGTGSLERAFTRFNVPLMDVGRPKEFEERLRVDVIFKIVKTSTGRDPGRLEAHAVYGVPSGVRATLQDGVWAREIRKAPAKATCVIPPELGRPSPAEKADANRRKKRTRITIGGAAPKTSNPVDGPTPNRAAPTKPVNKPKTSGGLNKAQIAATIDHYGGAIRVCYNKELGQNPKLAGRLTYQFTIQPNGKTRAVKETDRTLKSDAVAECIQGILEGMRFPTFKGSPVTIVYPFVFGT